MTQKPLPLNHAAEIAFVLKFTHFTYSIQISDSLAFLILVLLACVTARLLYSLQLGSIPPKMLCNNRRVWIVLRFLRWWPLVNEIRRQRHCWTALQRSSPVDNNYHKGNINVRYAIKYSKYKVPFSFPNRTYDFTRSADLVCQLHMGGICNTH